MKNKSVFKLFFMIWLFFLCNSTQAFFGEEAWLDLYKNLNENYSSINSDAFEYELVWTYGSIKEKINSIINIQSKLQKKGLSNCMQKDLAPSHIKAIYEWNTALLYEKIWDNCKDSSWNINNDTLTFLQWIIKNYYLESYENSQEQLKVIWDISSLWIYSDGNLDNSSFDIINDIEEINKIIFSNSSTYQWEESQNYQDYFNWLFEDKKQEVAYNTTDKIVLAEITGWEIAFNNEETWWDFLQNLLESHQTNNNICIDPNSWDHWLDISFLSDFSLDDSQTNVNEELFTDIIESQNNSWSTNSWNLAKQISWNYKGVNDNSMWPCDNFFCITVDFTTYNHQLLGGWENITIEYIIDRSNQHLSKFANSSLIPAKMTTNNFELWLTNLDLSELFHMSFQIQTKPVPILSLEDWEKDPSKDKNSSNSLLEKYYKAYWLDYKRRNDITIFNSDSQELSSIIQSTDSQITDATNRIQQLETYLSEQEKEVDLMKKDISTKFTQENFSQLHNQLIEINNFTKSITQYTKDLWNLIDAMDKIKTNG